MILFYFPGHYTQLLTDLSLLFTYHPNEAFLTAIARTEGLWQSLYGIRESYSVQLVADNRRESRRMQKNEVLRTLCGAKHLLNIDSYDFSQKARRQ